MSERRMWPTPQAFDANQCKRKSPDAIQRAFKRSTRNLREFVEPEWAEMMWSKTEDLSQLTLFAEAFPANRTPSLADAADLPTSATSGPNSTDSFASLDRDGSWLKMSQGYCQLNLDGSSETFSETWPRAGMTQRGRAYELPTLAPLTDAIGSGSWPIPTPTAGDVKAAGSRNTAQSAAHFGVSLTDYVRQDEGRGRQWSTPTVRDANTLAKVTRGRGSLDDGQEWIQPLPVQVGGTLNPRWVSVLMGYPPDWTEVE